MPVTRAADSPTWQLPGTLFTGLASPSRGDSSEVAVWRVRMQAGTPATAHSVTRTEVFVAVAGAAEVLIAGETNTLRPGDTLVVPANTEFELSAPGDEDFEAVVCLPVGGRAVIPGVQPMTPPWTE